MTLAHDLDRYNAAVQWILGHRTPDSSQAVSLPPQYADLGYKVYYERDATCGVRIDFLWGDGFPVKHVLRRYAVDPKWTSVRACSKDWGRITRIAPNWYEISD